MVDNISSTYSLSKIISERENIVQKIKEILIHRLNLDYSPERISHDAVLFGGGLGLDSIDALQLIVGIEAEFQITLPQDQSSILRSVNTIADYIISFKNPVSGYFQKEISARKNDASEHEMHNDAYFSLRNNMGIIIHHDLSIFELQCTAQSWNALDKLLSRKVKQLSENNILQSLILDNTIEHIKILAYVELYHCGDHFLLLIPKAVKALLSEKIPEAVEVTEKFDLFSIEGPNSFTAIRQIANSAVLGLRLHSHILTKMNAYSLRLANISHTGEAGLLFFSPKEYTQSLLSSIENTMGQKLKNIEEEVYRLLEFESSEIGFKLSLLSQYQESPYEAGLNWLVDGEKYPEKNNHFEKKLVLFKSKQTLEFHANYHSITVNRHVIGYIGAYQYSPTLQEVIGYAYVSLEYAHPGVVTDEKFQFISAPFFITKSIEAK